MNDRESRELLKTVAYWLTHACRQRNRYVRAVTQASWGVRRATSHDWRTPTVWLLVDGTTSGALTLDGDALSLTIDGARHHRLLGEPAGLDDLAEAVMTALDRDLAPQLLPTDHPNCLMRTAVRHSKGGTPKINCAIAGTALQLNCGQRQASVAWTAAANLIVITATHDRWPADRWHDAIRTAVRWVRAPE